jgi:glutamyl-tRNA reductase
VGELVAVGLNAQTAPVDVRERLAVTPDALPAVYAGLRALAGESLVLSTCNRVEVFALLDAGSTPGDLVGYLLGRVGDDGADLLPYLYSYTDRAAVRHLFRVAAGLDSMVLGEDQILAQVKTALDGARAAGGVGPVLHRHGQEAITSGKAVRTSTAISRHHLSVVSTALRLAVEQGFDWRDRTVLLVGAGRTGELACKHLAGRPPARLLITNRTPERATALAAHYNAEAVPWAARAAALAAADLVICCTGAPDPVLDQGMIAATLAARPDRPLLALDLAVPRDVDSHAAHLPGFHLIDVDHLEAICATNRRHRAGEIAAADALIAEGVARFLAWWQARGVAPTVTALRVHAEAIRDAEVARTLARLSHLTPDDAAAVRYLADALVNKLLHAPVTALKAAPDGPDLAGAVQQLFGLPE